MARQARRRSGSGYYHVMIRGINKERIFEFSQDKGSFMRVFRQKQEESDLAVAAYCLMDNHFHMVAKSELDELADFMKKISVSYAAYYNLNRDRVGHVFQGRFRSEPVENDPYLFGVIRYVHRNPLEAGLVSKFEEWPWSSYFDYLGNSGIVDPGSKKIVLDLYGSLKKFKEAHQSWDCDEYLDERTVMEGRRRLKAENLCRKILDESGLETVEELKKDRKELRKAVAEMSKGCGLNHREIAEQLKVGIGVVVRANR